ncbi:MAG: hypothetical protein SNG38_02540 [Rikenellaceae bacterium]
MKKSLSFALLITSALFILSCSSPKSWNAAQRVEFITMLDPYRNMVYLDEFNDAEYLVFTTDISTDAENSYPVYTEFISMPALKDTLDVWVVSSIVEDLNTDAANMRYLYPYHTLVEQGILPEGMDHAARKAFYECFAQKVNASFASLETFFYAVITNSIEPNIISDMQSACSPEVTLIESETVIVN